jgi:hypothetical protein
MKAKIKFESNQNINLLLDILRDTPKSINKKIAYQSFEILEIEWLFLCLIDFGYSLSIESKKNIIRKVFDDLVTSNKFDKDFFLTKLQEQVKSHNSDRQKEFYVLSSISINKLPFRKINIGKSTIRIHGTNFPKKFKEKRNTFLKSKDMNNDDEKFIKISIQVRVQNFKDAYEEALYYLEIFRSLLCLQLNHNREFRFGMKNTKSINRIKLGECSTLHFPNGEIVDDRYNYYTPDYQHSDILILKLEQAEKLRKSINVIINRFNKCQIKHQYTIGIALNNYVSAFDEKNNYISFLKVWTVLEILTDTHNNDLLIKRCTSLFDNKLRKLEEQKLECLRLFRNEFVHEGNIGLDPLLGCYIIQEFIYRLILKFNLEYSGYFNDIFEANLFLDTYNSDTKSLIKKRKIINKVISIKNN